MAALLVTIEDFLISVKILMYLISCHAHSAAATANKKQLHIGKSKTRIGTIM